MKKLQYLFLVPLATLLAGNASATTLIDQTFDGVANDTGPAFQLIENGFNASTGSFNSTNGTITLGNENLSAVGINSSSLVDVSTYTSFTATFDISSGSSDYTDRPGAGDNGWFLGIVSGANATETDGAGLFNKGPDPLGLGYVVGSDNYNDHRIIQTGATNGSTVVDDSAGTAPTVASVDDGFTMSLTVNDDGTYSMTSIGLSTEINATGSIDGTYADLVSGGIGLYTTFQGDASEVFVVDSATLTAVPEPSTFALLAGMLGFTWVMLRRRS